MDDQSTPKKKIDSTRKQIDSVRPRMVVPQDIFNVAQKKSVSRKNEASISLPLPKKDSLLERSDIERSGSSIISLKDTGLIDDASLRKAVLPKKFVPINIKQKYIFVLCCGLIAAAGVATLLSTVFARVTITVKPVIEELQIEHTDMTLSASASEVNSATHTIPAELLSFEGSIRDDFDATGSDMVNQKASGRIRIYNAFGTSPQMLVATTRFITDDGILYRLPQNIIIPGATREANNTLVPAFIEADVFADKAGIASNREGEVKLRIPGFQGSPKYDGFYGIAMQGFSGGSTGQARIITQSDLEAAQQKVSKRVFDELKQRMVQKIPPTFRLVDSLSEIQIISIDAPKEKTKLDRFSVEAKAIARVFVFHDADLIKFLNEFMLKEDKTNILIDTSSNLHYQIKNAHYDKKIAQISMNGIIKTKKVIDSNDITHLAAGKKEGSLIDALNQRKDIATFRVAFFPPWMFSVPKRTNHINVIIEEPTLDIISR